MQLAHPLYRFSFIPRRKSIWQLRRLLTVLILMSFLPLSLRAGPGAEIYNELLEKDLIYPDPEWQTYVSELGERLLNSIEGVEQTYTFTVVDQSLVNAWATPDAYIFVTRGILSFLSTEDELAAVLGHEIGHVVGKHSKRSVSNKRLGTALGLLGALATGSGSTITLANSLTSASIASYGRQYELEADQFGASLLNKAGYDPMAALNAIMVLQDHDAFQKKVMNRPTIYHGLLGSHPAHRKRLHSLGNKERESQENGEEYLRDYLSMLDGLVFGDGSSTGILKEGTYYHANLRLKISLPDDWTVRSGARQIMLEDTQGARTVTIGRSALPTEDQTPESYIKETLGRDDVASGEMLEIGTYQGYLGEIENSDPKLSARLMAVIFKDRDVFVFDAKQRGNEDPEDFKQVFLSILLSIKSMSGEDSRLINQQRLELAFAQPGDTFEQLAKYSPLTSNAAETLRVINGFFPNGQPRAGDVLKIVK